MAIVIEESKKPVNWIAILGVIIFIAVLFAGVYFFFFQNPKLIEVVAPPALQNLGRISKLSFNPDVVAKSPVFNSLQNYGNAPTIPPAGKSNPFKPF